MGIFSLFGKKDRPPEPADKEMSRKKRDDAAARSDANNEAERSQVVQRKAAHATSLKIDAIESEMSSEFVRPVSPGGITRPAAVPNVPPAAAGVPETDAKKDPNAPLEFEPTLPMMGLATAFLLGGETVMGPIKGIATSEATPAIEEAAILFANNQTEMVEHVLQSAIREDGRSASTRMVWAMLFDLYQVTGNQVQFDNLSIEYASKFETSPPAWSDMGASESQSKPAKPSSATPAVPFVGKLDENIVKLLDRVKNLSEKSKVLRLEFVRVTDVDPAGCELLLNVLKKLQKSGHDLILVGAPELTDKIRAILEVGRRDETEAPWLLLLEVLRLLNRENEFEEASIDYCVTFEVSPPAFVAPKNKVTTALDEALSETAATDRFMMPVVIEGRTDILISSIGKYVAEHNPAILDCSRLKRVDFSSAGQLLSGLAPLSSGIKVIELHEVNHLVLALFNVMGLKDIVRILPRKI